MSKAIPFPSPAKPDAVILARVSSRDQEDGYSIDAQRQRLEQYCRERGMKVISVYEIVESSTRGDRKKFMEMIKFIKARKRPIALVADKIDRVQRSFKEHTLLNDFIASGNLELHFRSDNCIVNRDTNSQGKFIWTMGVALAQNYTDSLSDNVKRAFSQKMRNGEWLSAAPLGYLNARLHERRGTLKVDEARAPLVAKMFETFATGNYSISQLTDLTRQWGLKNRIGLQDFLPRSQVHKILRNPFYYGMMVIKGQLYQHHYERIVPKAVFDACQRVLDSRSSLKTAWRGHEFAFRGLLVCHTTGRMVTADRKTRNYKKGGSASWTYLRCWHQGSPPGIVWVREDHVMGQIESAMRRIQISDEMMKDVRDWLRGITRAERGYHKREKEELLRQTALIEKRIHTLMDCLLDKTISSEDYDAKRANLRKQQLDIEEQMANSQAGDDGFHDAVVGLLSLCQDFAKTFRNASVEQQRAMLNLVFANLRLDGRTLCFTYRKPFDLFAEMSSVQDGWGSRTCCEPILERIRVDNELRQQVTELWQSVKMADASGSPS